MRKVIIIFLLLISVLAYSKTNQIHKSNQIQMTFDFKGSGNTIPMDIFNQTLLIKVKNISNKSILILGAYFYFYDTCGENDPNETLYLYLKKGDDRFFKLDHFVHFDYLSTTRTRLRPDAWNIYQLSMKYISFPQKYVYEGWIENLCFSKSLPINFYYLLKPGKYILKVVLDTPDVKGEGYFSFIVKDPGFWQKIFIFVKYNKYCLLVLLIELIGIIIVLFILKKLLKPIFKAIRKIREVS
ncbi:hypothetical protein TTHT_2008 [Thermotomaculum hydrothermale]|uniref:Uncharacterized protein n=1 Tax=Thermotomaculum hydrothermale TaxID=981385 RepID=A0A7R6T063_9BACT|nr:hypothetical protein [Thermotomaculum hydrothermale]BBB33450.1 hypothetical protein TTHT_2008 [Thermotomaculum hydrothermale]